MKLEFSAGRDLIRSRAVAPVLFYLGRTFQFGKECIDMRLFSVERDSIQQTVAILVRFLTIRCVLCRFRRIRIPPQQLPMGTCGMALRI